MPHQIDKNIIEIISLASKYPSIKRVGIFGSYARGDQKKGSDIDILYDYDEADEQSTDDLLGYIEEIHDILLKFTQAAKIDYVWYKGLIDSDNNIFKNKVLNDVAWIYG